MKLIVTGQSIEWEETRLMASGSDGIYEVGFEFGDDADLPDWGDLSKFAVFKNSSLPQYPDGVYAPISDGTAQIPSCILTERGKLYVGVYGQNGYYTMPTIWAAPVMIEAGCAEGEEAVVPVQTSAQNAIKYGENAKVFSEGGYIVKKVNGTVDDPDLERLPDYTKGAKDYALEAQESAEGAGESEQSASESAEAAMRSATSAGDSALDAESYAKGGTGRRENEDTDNAKYYKEQAGESATAAGQAKAAIEALQVIVNGLAAGAAPTVTKTIVDGHVLFTFGIPKGDKGDKGDTGNTGAAAGFGTPTATVDSTIGTPAVTITTSGPDTAKVFNFAFTGLKGERGDDSVQEFLYTGLYVDDEGYLAFKMEGEE